MPKHISKKSRGVFTSNITHSAQVSLEYLMTYGWALILVAAIVGILVIVIGTPSGYACSSEGIVKVLLCNGRIWNEGEDLFLILSNNVGSDIIINPFTGIAFDGRTGYAAIVFQETEYRFGEITIPKGASFKVKGIGVNDAGTVTITYTDTSTGFQQTQTINTNTPNNEICNNGIDDPGSAAGLDALDPECEEAVYNDGGFIPGTSTLTGTTKTINVDPIETKDGSPLAEAWEMTEAKVYFNATSVLPGTTIRARYGPTGSLSASQSVTEGWNEIAIPTTGETYDRVFVPFQSFILIATTDFTMSEPNVLVTLKELP